MKFKTVKNKKNIYIYKKNEINLKVNKFLFIYLLNILQSKKIEENQFKKIENFRNQIIYLRLLSSKISKTKLFRNCILTRRSRAVYRPYGLSRCALKELIQFGKLPGYSQAIW